ADQSSRQHGEIRLVHHGIQILGWDIQAPSAAYTNVGQGTATGAFLEDSVLVRKDRNPQRFRGSEEGRRQRIGVWRSLHVYRSPGAAAFRVRGSVPIFDAFVDFENVLVAPACIS